VESILSTLSASTAALGLEKLPEILQWNQLSASKAKEWFKAAVPKIINAGKGLTGPGQSAPAPILGDFSPAARASLPISQSSHSDDSDSCCPPRRKRQMKCPDWTKVEQRRLSNYYVLGKYIKCGKDTGKLIKARDENDPDTPDALERFNVNQIAEKLKAMSKAQTLGRL
jgi:hypothetical protein